MTQPIKVTYQLTPDDQGILAIDLLSRLTNLPKLRLKDAMSKGAVWLKRKKQLRLRRIKEPLRSGDVLSIYYDDALLSLALPDGIHCLEQNRFYSVWFKPAGVMSQGTQFGDHLSLLRYVEVATQRPVFLIHRLDKETQGIMLIAHQPKSAAALTSLFTEHKIRKIYTAEVLGKVDSKGEMAFPLDEKPAHTLYECMAYDDTLNISHVRIELKTGRTHQIRRHFDMIGHPVIGDPRYGKGNKNIQGLKLTASELIFTCPFTHEEKHFA
ncbi:RluA family pseudouridine synthase [Nitrincola nitratireducens]|uniref:tRNA pseudouridine synthase C n=1 Tax=Nitrincola nitratireducens TaxID=1229521 RepID=W9V7G7_9GAMM|nr:RluA family pseudouridine synthase [Nitrincola nitratireducens]EXJ12816.1 tRNA pseudouridine synthase C [Nitrincola nitratireducens]